MPREEQYDFGEGWSMHTLEPVSNEFDERYTDTPWGRMFSRSTRGAAHPEIPVVLIPGMVISSRYMIPLARQLAPYCAVHMIDFPGYGKSEKPPDILKIPDLADVLHTWIVSNGLQKANFVANSFGCQIAAELAIQHPECIETLVLQGPTVDPEARHIVQQMVRLKLNSRRESKSVGMISVKDYHSAGLKRVLKTIWITMHDHIEEKLPGIRSKTLIVRGDRDPVVPQAWAERAAALVPGGRLCVIPGGAHTLNYSEPERFSREILRFLELETPHG